MPISTYEGLQKGNRFKCDGYYYKCWKGLVEKLAVWLRKKPSAEVRHTVSPKIGEISKPPSQIEHEP